LAHVRYDKLGRRLPDTGHGCGCGLCADSNAPRYERRSDPGRDGAEWGSLQRRLVKFVRSLGLRGRSELA
jgi:hypothetical protein